MGALDAGILALLLARSTVIGIDIDIGRFVPRLGVDLDAVVDPATGTLTEVVIDTIFKDVSYPREELAGRRHSPEIGGEKPLTFWVDPAFDFNRGGRVYFTFRVSSSAGGGCKTIHFDTAKAPLGTAFVASREDILSGRLAEMFVMARKEPEGRRVQEVAFRNEAGQRHALNLASLEPGECPQGIEAESAAAAL
jgi:hypothetical protein